MTEIKLCKDCKYFREGYEGRFFKKIKYFCDYNKDIVDFVTGKINSGNIGVFFTCYPNRINSWLCGYEARWFEPKED